MKTPLRLAYFLFILPLLLMAYAIPAHSADCPTNVDPVYCQGAAATGGKIYSGTPEENLKNLEDDMQADISQQHRDIIITATKMDITLFFQGVLFFLPALCPLIILTILRKKIEKPKLFTTLYTIGNTLPALYLCVYFFVIGSGYGLTKGFLIFAGVAAIISCLIAHSKRNQILPLYIVAILSGFLAYLPILAFLSLVRIS